MESLISVIIPCYNVEQYIERCFNSLTKQSIGIENLELIFVNDASTDSTLDKLLEFEKQYPNNIMVIDLSENSKQGAARNIGLKYANSDYIGFVDSDDWIEECMYEKLYDKIQEYNCDVVGCSCFFDYADGSSTESEKGEDLFIIIDEEKEIEGRYKAINLDLGSGVWSKLYKKSLIMDNEIFFPENLTYEDNYWMSILRFYIKSFYRLQEDLYHYFIRSESTVNALNSASHFDRLTIEMMKIDKFKDLGVFEIYHDEFEFEFLNYFYFNTLYILVTKFDVFPVDVIFYIVECVLKLFPNYKNNPYLEKLTEDKKCLLKLLEMSLNEEEWNTIADAYREMLLKVSRAIHKTNS